MWTMFDLASAPGGGRRVAPAGFDAEATPHAMRVADPLL
jgi:hypothetical protein